VAVAIERQKPKNTPEWQAYECRRYASQFATERASGQFLMPSHPWSIRAGLMSAMGRKRTLEITTI